MPNDQRDSAFPFYTGPDAEPDPAFVARVARPLRGAERLPADFEYRLLAAVRAGAAPRPTTTEHELVRPVTTDRAAPDTGWWRRPRDFRVTPLGGLMMAAGFAGLVCLATLQAVGGATAEGSRAVASSPAGALAPAARDTVHVVRFVLVEPGARQVSLVGDFNGWTASATPLAAAGQDGVWVASIALPPGRHEYAFVVDGTRWTVDPTAPPVRDEHDTESSVITVGPARTPSA